MRPLVSILIPAYNAREWIAYALRSAIAQTWRRKEIIVVDDGSTDGTAEIVHRLFGDSVTLVSTLNQGAAAARNHALRLSKGDYIQWLDADDLLAPDKIERQLAGLHRGNKNRTLLSSAWAPFYYRTRTARFVRNSLWQDLSPVEWLLRRMGENLYMQTATWLTSRELTEAAGPWDTRLLSDDDCEYFCRVLLASDGTRFTPEARSFYRATSSSRLSYIGRSDRKKDALLISAKLHIQYLRSLEDSERVWKACIAHLQNCYEYFYPERIDLVGELHRLAAELHGRLEEPRFRRTYAWITPFFGHAVAKSAQRVLPQLKSLCLRHCDKAVFKFETSRMSNFLASRRDRAPQSAC